MCLRISRPTCCPISAAADYVFLANISPELQAHVLAQVASPKVVAADTMNLWINNERPALIAACCRRSTS